MPDYTVNMDGRDLEVGLAEGERTGVFFVQIGEARHRVERLQASAEHMQLRIDEGVHTFSVAVGKEGLWLCSRGRTRFVPVAQRPSRRFRKGAVGSVGDKTIVRAKTPSVVTRILVEVGDQVVEGQGLVVVSAMKMEVTLSAGCAGKVTAIGTRVGASVSPAEVLVSLEPSGDAPTQSNSDRVGENS